MGLPGVLASDDFFELVGRCARLCGEDSAALAGLAGEREADLAARRARPDGYAYASGPRTIPLHREALFGADNSHAAAKTYETFTAAASESASCQCRVIATWYGAGVSLVPRQPAVQPLAAQ